MAFFTRWWRAQPLSIRQLVFSLVQTGRLQFALGAWSMADEATVYYGDAIDQMTKGRDVLKRIFGDCGIPHASWQIDPFGHARDHAELFRDSGFDAVFFQRMDYREKLARRQSKSLEVLWDTDVKSSADQPGLFTSMFYDTYCYPTSFCFDDKCYDPPIQDDPELENYNVYERVDQFLRYVYHVRKSFLTDHIMVLMGCDFTYENANINFKNTDKLIKYANQRQMYGSQINLLYSTPQCYTKAVNEAFKQRGSIDRRTGDFFPYASGPNSYWTGYYTSRPALKGFIRTASTLLTMCEHIHVFSNSVSKYRNKSVRDREDALVDELRQALGVMQHHDAVTGTEKQHVANDYAQTLSRASKSCQMLISQAAMKLIPQLPVLTGTALPVFCDSLNISLCSATEGWKPYTNSTGHGGVYILVYNPTAWELWSSWIRVPLYIDEKSKKGIQISLRHVHDPPSVLMSHQLIPITEQIMNIPERHSTMHMANYELVFNAASSISLVPPFGFAIFHLALSQNTRDINSRYLRRMRRTHGSTRYAQCFRVSEIQRSTKFQLLLTKDKIPLTIVAEHLASKTRYYLTVEMLYYFGETNGPQASGAYIFLPKYKSLHESFDKPTHNFYAGSCVEEVYLVYASWASLVVRLYADGELEVHWNVGPIPDGWHQFSREIILRYTVRGEGIQPGTSGEFFTDSAGRRLIRRLRNHRPDWNISETFRETQPVAGNYYPIVNRIVLKGTPPAEQHGSREGSKRPAMGFAVYTDRPQGGSSLLDGQVEIMIHRRLVRDDGYGVAEALVEQGEDRQGLIVRGRHRLRFDELSVIEKEDRVFSQMVTKEPVIMFAPSVQKISDSESTGWTGLNYALPPQLHLLSLCAWPLVRATAEPNAPDQILLRLEHLSNSTSTDSNGRSYQLDVTHLLRGLVVTGATEVILTADQEVTVAQSKRLHWPTENSTAQLWTYAHHVNHNPTMVTLFITEGAISSFILDYELVAQN